MTSATELRSRQLAARWLDQRLAHDEQTRLAHSGFVNGERLPSGTVAYKLRFRGSDQRQRVLYVGTNRQLAESIRAELARRQFPIFRRRKCRALAARARSKLRGLKQRLEPALAARGIHFHGYEIRMHRRVSRACSARSES